MNDISDVSSQYAGFEKPKRQTRTRKYTPKLAEEICERLSKGETLRSICRDGHMPTETAVRKWALEDKDGFYAIYRAARDIGLDAMADEVIDIADDSTKDFIAQLSEDGEEIEQRPDHEHINRSRLRVDTRKWYLSKLAPKRYGERTQVDNRFVDGEGNDRSITVKFVKSNQEGNSEAQ